MRTIRIAAVGSAVAALALTPAVTQAGNSKTYWPGCSDAQFKPKTIILACGDANAQIKNIDWSSWGKRKAKGKGTGRFNTCDPNCAQGKFKKYPVNVKLSKRHFCKGAGKHEFKRIDYVFPDKHPTGYDKKNHQTFPCSGK